jgi:hypothetical protein
MEPIWGDRLIILIGVVIVVALMRRPKGDNREDGSAIVDVIEDGR